MTSLHTLKNVGDNALSGLPKFSAAALFNTQHSKLSSAYTDTFNRRARVW
jgi:hypothetical protein